MCARVSYNRVLTVLYNRVLTVPVHGNILNWPNPGLLQADDRIIEVWMTPSSQLPVGGKSPAVSNPKFRNLGRPQARVARFNQISEETLPSR